MEDATNIVVDGEYLFLAVTYANSYASLLNADQATYDLNVSSISTLNNSDSNKIRLEDILKVLSNK